MHIGQSVWAVHLGGRLVQCLTQPVLGRIEVMRIRLPNLRLILAGRATSIAIYSHNNNGQNGAKYKDCKFEFCYKEYLRDIFWPYNNTYRLSLLAVKVFCQVCALAQRENDIYMLLQLPVKKLNKKPRKVKTKLKTSASVDYDLDKILIRLISANQLGQFSYSSN